MRHLFLAENDFAASGFAFVQALRAVGETAREFIAVRHEYQYAAQGESFPPAAEVRAAFAAADCIWLVQSDLPRIMGGWWGVDYAERPLGRRALASWARAMTGKRLVLLHGGGCYREGRAFYVDLWAQFKPLSLCYSADLMGGFEHEYLALPPVDTDRIRAHNTINPVLTVGHFPSRPTDKGSAEILPALRSIQGIAVRTNVTDPRQETGCIRVPNDEQLRRMAACDVIVDQICPTLNGYPFGEWVSLTLEAAALGRVVITNSQRPEAYQRDYGRRPALRLCNTIPEMVAEVRRLRDMHPADLYRLQGQTRRWVVETHGLKPSGERLLRLLGQPRAGILTHRPATA